MRISLNIFLAVVAVFCIFTQHSHANPVESLQESAAAEKMMTDPKFLQIQESAIMEGTDRDSLAAKACIEDIRKEVKKFKVHEIYPLAVDTAINGVIDAVKLVHGMITQANIAIDAASKRAKAGDTEGAIQIIKTALKSDRELIFIAGVPIHDAQGMTLGLVGGLALPGLRNTIVSIQHAGSAAFEVLEIADEIATAGAKIGESACEESFKSARNVLSTGALAIYSSLREASTRVLEALQDAVSKVFGEEDIVPGIVESLKTKIVTDNQAAFDAIARLTKGLKSALSVLTKKAAIDAGKVMVEGLKSTIVETADAMSIAKKSLEEARELATHDPEAAVAVVRKGIKSSQDRLLSGSAYGYLAVGAAGQLAGKQAAEELVPSVIDIEYGRVTAYEDLALAERIAIVGIRGGPLSIAQGINTALQMCDAAGISLYQDYADAGEIGFGVLRKV